MLRYQIGSSNRRGLAPGSKHRPALPPGKLHVGPSVHDVDPSSNPTIFPAATASITPSQKNSGIVSQAPAGAFPSTINQTDIASEPLVKLSLSAPNESAVRALGRHFRKTSTIGQGIVDKTPLPIETPVPDIAVGADRTVSSKSEHPWSLNGASSCAATEVRDIHSREIIVSTRDLLGETELSWACGPDTRLEQQAPYDVPSGAIGKVQPGEVEGGMQCKVRRIDRRAAHPNERTMEDLRRQLAGVRQLRHLPLDGGRIDE
jgi:hypothetical protein